MVRTHQSIVAVASLSGAFAWDICSDPSHYTGSNTVTTPMDGVQYTCDQWKSDISSFTASLQSCSSPMPLNSGDTDTHALTWFTIVRDDCCGTGKEVVCDPYMTYDPCKTGETYTPNSIVAAWKDTATNADTKCSEGLFYYLMPKFTPSVAECAKKDVNMDGDSSVTRYEVLQQMSAECCGGSMKDICADHSPEAAQICATNSDFQESPLIPDWQGATCLSGRQYYFSDTFTASSTTCKEIVGPPENRYARDVLLQQMSEPCCGGKGKDVCSNLPTSTTASDNDSDSAMSLAASAMPVVLAGLATF